MNERASSLLGVFGGSVDPPHIGHVALVRAALERGLVSRVVVVPVFSHALHKKSSSFATRVELARLAFSELSAVEVSELESTLPVPSYTLSTLRAVGLAHPDARLRLLAGADIAGELHRWHRVDEVLSLAPLLLFSRQGVESPEGTIAAEIPEVSSSELRSLLRRRRAEKGARERLAELLPAKVLEEIEARSLYPGSDD